MNFRLAQLSRNEAVFGIIFEVAARIRRPVRVCGRAVPAYAAAPESLFAERFAKSFNEVDVPGAGDNRFGGIGDDEVSELPAVYAEGVWLPSVADT